MLEYLEVIFTFLERLWSRYHELFLIGLPFILFGVIYEQIKKRRRLKTEIKGPSDRASDHAYTEKENNLIEWLIKWIGMGLDFPFCGRYPEKFVR